MGVLVPSVDGFLGYLERNARLWEKQALLKARVVAGDAAVGDEFLRRAEPLLFGLPRWLALSSLVVPALFVLALIPIIEKGIPNIPLGDDEGGAP